ncbi:MAG: AraC family transcriptional regulator [Lachnospiraceae bacterium]|nr:AraC family transcriptional regulator [Lachnospiraceae bacterium]
MDRYYDMLFRQAQVDLYISRLTLCAPDWREDNITLDFCKIYYFLDGEGKLVINGDTYYPKAGEMFLIPSGVRHSYSHNPENPVYKYWCHFALKLGEFSKFLYHKDCVFCRPDKEYAKGLFARLCELDGKDGYLERLLQKSCLLELCHLFFSSVPVERMLIPQKDDFYYIVSNFIASHLAERLTIAELAETVRLQPNYFVNRFKKSFGTTPIEYINTLRLDAASKEIIASTGKSIEEIAHQSGFEDYRYFGRIFKRRYGASPRSFRKM